MAPLHSSHHKIQVQSAASSLACFFWTRMQAPWLEHKQPSRDHEVTDTHEINVQRSEEAFKKITYLAFLLGGEENPICFTKSARKSIPWG